MANTKISWATCLNDDSSKEPIYFEHLDSDLYNSKYRGKLYCINTCKAKIKFTQRKDNSKFFSTWNKEGSLHNEDCPYHVEYQGKMGRKKLKERYESQAVDVEHIKRTIRNRINNLKGIDKIIELKNKGTNLIENIGEKEIAVAIEGESIGEVTSKRVYIGSLDAEHMTDAYIDTRKCVYGKIDNVQLNVSKNNEVYVYFNLKNTVYNVSVYIPPAFYHADNNVQKLNEFAELLMKKISNKREKDEFVFVGVGFIKRKKGKGINVEILNKEHFVINETSYDRILSTRNIEQQSYTI